MSRTNHSPRGRRSHQSGNSTCPSLSPRSLTWRLSARLRTTIIDFKVPHDEKSTGGRSPATGPRPRSPLAENSEGAQSPSGGQTSGADDDTRRHGGESKGTSTSTTTELPARVSRGGYTISQLATAPQRCAATATLEQRPAACAAVRKGTSGAGAAEHSPTLVAGERAKSTSRNLQTSVGNSGGVVRKRV